MIIPNKREILYVVQTEVFTETEIFFNSLCFSIIDRIKKITHTNSNCCNANFKLRSEIAY